MFERSFPSANKRGYSEDETYLPTAEKQHFAGESDLYIQRSPNRKLFGSPMGKGSRVSEAHRSIDECIFMVSEKKKMNSETLSEVQHVNNEILSSLSNLNPAKNNTFNLPDYRNRTEEPIKKDSFRNNVVTSQFDWKPSVTSPKAAYQSSFKEPSYNQENVELGTRLQEEVRKNNDLIRHIGQLQNEMAAVRASKVQSMTNVTMNDVMEENKFLRSQLVTSQANVQFNLIEELERLKAQNSALRRDTVTLLKTKHA